jgi:hypothetical protein
MRPGTTISLTSVASFPTAVREMELLFKQLLVKLPHSLWGGGINVLETSLYGFLPEARAVDPEVMDEQFERYLREEGYRDKSEG